MKSSLGIWGPKTEQDFGPGVLLLLLGLLQVR